MAKSQKMDELSRMLECSICLERMKSPRILPCLHSFCEECLGRHMAEKVKKGTFPCPICNTRFEIPVGGVLAFKRNYFLAEVSELVVESSDDVKCEMCSLRELDAKATSMCLQCRDHLCQTCAQSHCMSKLTFNHRVVSLEDVRNGEHFDEIRQFQKVYCSVHTGEVLKLYCEVCEVPVCLMCKALDHDQHKMKNIQDAAKHVHDVMQGLTADWQNAARNRDQLSTMWKKVLESIKEQEEQVTKDIEQAYDSYEEQIRNKIKVERAAAIKSLTEQVKTATKQAEVAYNEAEFNRIKISGTLKYVDSILDSAQDVEKLQQFSVIKSRLENRDVEKTENRVIKPSFQLESPTFVAPDIKITVASHPTYQPIVRERAVRVRCLSTRFQGETACLCIGMCVTENRLIITDSHNKKVKIFDKSSGSFLFQVNQVRLKLYSPVDVTCNKDGEMFVTDDSRHIRGVVKFDERGSLMKVAKKLLTKGHGSIGGFITCHDDKLLISDYRGERILITDFDCVELQIINKEALDLNVFRPRYMCLDNGGHLVVSDWDDWGAQSLVYVIDYNQQAIIKTFTRQQSDHDSDNAPWSSVCVDQWGQILVAGNNQVLMSSTPDHVQALITSDDVTSPSALAISGPGEIAVLERDTGDVKIFKYTEV